MSHTPTPWKLRDGQAITVQQREFGLDCKIMAQGPNTTLANGDFHIASDLTKENAEFVVRACNSHDALVAALERVIRETRGSSSLSNEALMNAEDALSLAQ